MTSPVRKTAYAALVILMLTALAYYFCRPSGDNPSRLPASNGRRSSNAGPDPVGQRNPSGVNEQGHPVAAGGKSPSTFYVAKSCYLTLGDIKRMQRDCDRLADNPTLQRAYTECLKDRDGLQPMLDSAQRSLAKWGCGDERDLFPKYYESTKDAAKSGNTDAQLCYLQSNFLDLNGKAPYTQADGAEYQASAPKYIEAAFSRGDWRIVQLLSSDHHGGIIGLALYIPNIGTPDTVYKMTRLLRLGANGEYAEQLDSMLDTLVRPDGHENPELPQARVADLDAWAQKTFSQYFAGAPGLTKPPFPCAVDQEANPPSAP